MGAGFQSCGWGSSARHVICSFSTIRRLPAQTIYRSAAIWSPATGEAVLAAVILKTVTPVQILGAALIVKARPLIQEKGYYRKFMPCEEQETAR